METQTSNSSNHEIQPVEAMQVKRRINQFFGNILRKDKVQHEDEEEPTFASSSSQVKGKQKNKSNQSYSQWDLMEHMAGEPIEDEETQTKCPKEDNIVYSDGLGYYTEVSLEDLHAEQKRFPLDEYTGKKQRSFLKRSGSLLRKSLRRSKKKSKNEENVVGAGGNYDITEIGSLTDVVQEINATILEVAMFGDENSQMGSKSLEEDVQKKPDASKNNILVESSNIHEEDKIWVGAMMVAMENGESCKFFDHPKDEVWNEQEERKTGIKNGLKRQASKLASKLKRTSGSVRLKPTVSIESFPNTKNARSVSFSTNEMISPVNPGLAEDVKLKKSASFRRKLSFKHAKKAMKNGVTSFGKSMIHASAVMPIAYESPPLSFYPDRNDEDDEYPQHLVQCYYRTVSYQPRDCHNGNTDKTGHQHGHCARPTSFYQHGYCYNG